MKKYKLLTKVGYPRFILGNLYSEEYKERDSDFSVEELVAKYPNDWELVEDDFVLPEKWYVCPETEGNLTLIKKWSNRFNDFRITHSDNAYTSDNKYFTFAETAITNGYTGITFEQFKTYVLNMKEEKEIIGYRLVKEEFLPALKMIDTYWQPNLHKHKGYNLQYGCGAYSKFKQAGVLDLWFEPVYKIDEPKYKINDFVKVTKNGCNASQFNTGNIFGVYSNNNWKNEVYTISSEPKFYDGGDYVQNDWVYELTDSKGNVAGNVYSYALRKATEEEIKAAQVPQITINGYKGEFFDEYVKFGCAQIDKRVFVQLYKNFYEELNGNVCFSNKEIESVTIGKGTFSKEQIKEIAEYYLNKEK